jgi:hypothetical protein
MNWNNVTVRQYQQLVELGKMELSDQEATTEAIAILSGMTINEVRQLTARSRIRWERRIGFIHQELKPVTKRYIKVNGRTYCNDINVRHMPSARYIETKYFGQDIIGNMHKLAAVMVYPVRKSWLKYKPLEYNTMMFEQYSDDMLDIPVTHAMGLLVFFCQRLKPLMTNLSDYLAKEVTNSTMTATESEMIFIRFRNSMDGFIRRLWSRNTTTSHWTPRIVYRQSNF